MSLSSLTKRSEMRILIRRQKGQDYLQPSGDWGQNKQTARAFASSVAAYDWAKERQLLGIDIFLSFSDPQYDFVTMRV